MWSVSTILTGLYSFMIETNPTLGSIETSYRKKRQYAASSLEYNVRDKAFCKLFPEYVERHDREVRERAGKVASEGVTSASPAPSSLNQVALRRAIVDYGMRDIPLAATLAGMVAVFSIAAMFWRYL